MNSSRTLLLFLGLIVLPTILQARYVLDTKEDTEESSYKKEDTEESSYKKHYQKSYKKKSVPEPSETIEESSIAYPLCYSQLGYDRCTCGMVWNAEANQCRCPEGHLFDGERMRCLPLCLPQVVNPGNSRYEIHVLFDEACVLYVRGTPRSFPGSHLFPECSSSFVIQIQPLGHNFRGVCINRARVFNGVDCVRCSAVGMVFNVRHSRCMCPEGTGWDYNTHTCSSDCAGGFCGRWDDSVSGVLLPQLCLPSCGTGIWHSPGDVCRCRSGYYNPFEDTCLCPTGYHTYESDGPLACLNDTCTEADDDNCELCCTDKHALEIYSRGDDGYLTKRCACPPDYPFQLSDGGCTADRPHQPVEYASGSDKGCKVFMLKFIPNPFCMLKKLFCFIF